MWLNLERVRYAQAVAVAQGTGFAHSRDAIPLIYFDSVSPDEKAAEMQHAEANAERAARAAIERLRAGGGL